MSLIDDFGYSDETPRAKWLNRLAHLFPWGTLAILVAYALSWGGLLQRGTWTSLLILTLIVPLLFIGNTHVILARICLRCMQAVPEDAPVRAATRRKRFWLRLNHIHLWWIIAVVVAWQAIQIVTTRVAGWDTTPGWMYMPADLLLVAVLWSNWQHHRYRPWCPWCRDWGSGGHPEHVPDPVNPATKVA